MKNNVFGHCKISNTDIFPILNILKSSVTLVSSIHRSLLRTYIPNKAQ